MKTILPILILLLISCESRKTATEKQTEKTDFQIGQNLSKTTETATKSETTFDFSKLMENENISIASDGNPYTLNYRGLFYTGSAAIEISNKKENIKTKIIQKIETRYKSVISYKSHITYKSQIIYKTKTTDRKSYPWYWIVLGSILIWEILKIGFRKVFPMFYFFNN